MGDLFLELGSFERTTAIANTFIDKYMANANGEFVKVYLYLLRCYQDRSIKVSVNSFADTLNCTEGDIIRAFKYWEEQSLISVCFDKTGEISGLRINECNDTDSFMESEDKKIEKKATKSKVVTKKKNTNIETLCEDEEFRDLVFAVATYLGKQSLTPKETDTIIYFMYDLEFSADLILHLTEYCVSNGKKNMRYIEKVAVSWTTLGITTIEAAKEQTNSHSAKYKCVLKACGITSRGPAQVEEEYINKWFDEFGFASEIVVEACNRTIKKTHEPSFGYVDSILTNWHNNGITNLDEVNELDEKFKSESSKSKITKLPKKSKTAEKTSETSFSAFPQRQYSSDELELKLLRNRAY